MWRSESLRSVTEGGEEHAGDFVACVAPGIAVCRSGVAAGDGSGVGGGIGVGSGRKEASWLSDPEGAGGSIGPPANILCYTISEAYL